MKIKAIITILISLIVGFILGFITEGQLVKRERNKWHKESYSQVFEDRVLHIIEPTESQKEQILPIIKTYAQKMNELRGITGQKFEELRKQMNNELKQFITDEQYKKLQAPRERTHNRKRPSNPNSPQPDQDRNTDTKKPG